MQNILVVAVITLVTTQAHALPMGSSRGLGSGLTGLSYSNPAAFNDLAGGVAGGVASSLNDLESRYGGRPYVGYGNLYGGLGSAYGGSPFGGSSYGGLVSPYGGLGALSGLANRGNPYSGGYLGAQGLGMNAYRG